MPIWTLPKATLVGEAVKPPDKGADCDPWLAGWAELKPWHAIIVERARSESPMAQVAIKTEGVFQ